MNKTIKKIVAFGVGASMLLGTGAAAVLAADLSAYPSPFVKDGVFVGKIVIGEKAMSIDTVGALDIAASLQRAATTNVAAAGAATQVEGSIRLDTSSDRIYYGEAFSVDSATGDDLSMLTNGSFEDDDGTVYDYTQSIVFAKTQTLAYDHADGNYNTDAFEAFELGTDAATPLYTAKVDFTKVMDATSTLVVGNKIELFGNSYTFSSDSVAADNKLVLFGSSEELSIGMGEEVTKTVNGKDWKIKVVGFTSTKVTLQVNGETYSIAQDATKTFGGSNGLRIYAKSVDSWDAGNAGTTGFATLQLGAEKLTLQDGENVMVGTAETDVDGTLVELGGNVTALTSIHVSVAAADSDTDFLAAGGSFVDPVFKTFKLVYSGNTADLKDATKDQITVDESGSSKLVAKVPTSAGSKTLNFNYQGALKWDQTKKILPIEGAAAVEDDYVYLAPADQKYTHLVQVTNIKTDDTTGYVEYKDVLSGAVYKTNEAEFNTAGDALTLTVDGKQYDVYMNTTTSVAAFYPDAKTVVYPEVELGNGETFFFTAPITPSTMVYNPAGLDAANDTTDYVFPGGQNGITQTATVTTVGLTEGELVYNATVAGGLVTALTITGVNQPAFNVKEPKDYVSAYEVISVTSGLDTANPSIASIALTGADSTAQQMADEDLDSYVDYYGAYVEHNTPSSDDSDSVTIYMPADQVYANVFLAPLAAAISTSSSSGAVSLNPISLGLAILDSEASLGSKPYIVVGGPCANTVAAALMNSGADCAAGFSEGKATIKLFADKNALLVAGYSGKDTQAACRVLASYKDPKYALSGTEIEVASANLAEPTIKKVSN